MVECRAPRPREYILRVFRMARQLRQLAAHITAPAAAVESLPAPTSVEELRTPCLVCDLPTAKANIARMQAKAEALGCVLRPHVKTHKTLELATLQTGGSKRCITVSTLAEAQFFAEGGFDDILYAVLITADKLPQAAALTRALEAFHIIVDHPLQLDAILGAPPPSAAKPWSVWLMVDCGYHRDGVEPTAPESIELAKRIQAASGVARLGGIYTHGGHSYSAASRAEVVSIAEQERDVTVEFAARLRAAGVTVPIVGVGSTPTCSNPPSHLDGVDEMHPGNYIFNDMTQAATALSSCTMENVAVRVLTRVIGHYKHSNMLLIDLGWTGCSDQGKDVGYGALVSHQHGRLVARHGLKIVNLKQEAGEVEAMAIGTATSDHASHGANTEAEPIDWERYKIGAILSLLPYHSCAAVKCHDVMHVLGEDGTTLHGQYTICRGW